MLKYLRLLIAFVSISWGTLAAAPLLQAEAVFPKINIRGDKIYAGDEELLLVTVGYSHLRPGQDFGDPVPYKDFGYDLLDLDMKRIKEAGFNSIRTWDLSDKKYLELAQKHGLWVVGGIWLNQKIDLSNQAELERQIEKVRAEASAYAEYPNVAMLLILNEPDFTMIAGRDPGKLKAYFDRLVVAAHASCPGVPVSFSNWPNAAFIDSLSWDIISYNLYATMPRFQNSIGYRGYVEGMIKAKSAGKPFYVSEYGFYTPTPNLDTADIFSYNYVDSEKKQCDFLLRDMETLYQLPIAGGALMSWTDNWDLASAMPSPSIIRPSGWIDRETHDNDCVEWAGILGMDRDVKGLPRLSYSVISRANQSILTQPDAETLYSAQVPVSIYIGDRVNRVNLIIDGTEIKDLPKSSNHWVRYQYVAKKKGLKNHSIKVMAIDQSNQLIHTIERSFWTAQDSRLPKIAISQLKDEKTGDVYFSFLLKDRNEDPIINAPVQWVIFDAYSWKESEGSCLTGTDGACRARRVSFSQVQLVGARYDYMRDGFRKKITDLYIYTYH
jgi:hypothetical protein